MADHAESDYGPQSGAMGSEEALAEVAAMLNCPADAPPDYVVEAVAAVWRMFRHWRAVNLVDQAVAAGNALPGKRDWWIEQAREDFEVAALALGTRPHRAESGGPARPVQAPRTEDASAAERGPSGRQVD